LALGEILSKSTSHPVDLVVHAGNLWGGGRGNAEYTAEERKETLEERKRTGEILGGIIEEKRGIAKPRKISEISGGVDLVEWHKMVRLLRDHVFGSRSIDFEVVWEKRRPNYACENINVGLPVWGIEGKLEAKGGKVREKIISGENCVEKEEGVWPVLETEGYVNWLRSEIAKPLTPVIIKKGETKIALYGLNYQRNIREVLEKGGIKLLMPQKEEEVFSILVMHLDGKKEEPEDFLKLLPKELDLVVFGGVETLLNQRKNNASIVSGNF
jgi:hypothetical protein